jgi:hypothetical protein
VALGFTLGNKLGERLGDALGISLGVPLGPEDALHSVHCSASSSEQQKRAACSLLGLTLPGEELGEKLGPSAVLVRLLRAPLALMDELGPNSVPFHLPGSAPS